MPASPASPNPFPPRAGSILLSFIAIIVALLLIMRSQVKKAAVGRREMQLFLLSYAFVSFLEIFSVGGFPLNGAVRRVRFCAPPPRQLYCF